MSKRKQGTKFVVGFTERAIRELHAIESYSIGQWGKRVADRYIKEIESATDLICSNPSLLQSDSRIPDAFVYYRAGKDVLICQRVAHFICVLTIVHTSMDLPTRLLELEPNILIESQILAAQLSKRVPPRP